MSWPRITVVTPSFNHGRFLEETIQSVLYQDYPNLEYIVMDGGSTDGSADIIRRYSDRLAYWVSRPDHGQTDALIQGFGRASGDVLCWLCADDVWESGTLREIGKIFASQSQTRAVYGDATFVDTRGRRIRLFRTVGFNRWIWLYTFNYIPQPSTFWRRDLYEQVGGLNPDLDICMDGELWLRFSEVTKMHHRRRSWSRMRMHPETKSARLRSEVTRGYREISRRYVGDDSDAARLAKRFLARSARVSWKAVTGCYF